MILRKADIFSVITILLFVGLKGTYVFFSWLNYFLLAAQLDLVAISSLVFAVGLLMFMLPIVPGTAVYLFSGVVLGFYSTSNGLHFGVGIAVGAVLASVLKHVACTGQYFIGYLAGKSVHVQRFVGVDKVPTRAMEMILNKIGFALGKVCILVAGPDFPTSVLCGILKLNIPQMLLGTTPVIVVSIIPQVAVGALLTLPGNEEYSALATVFAFVIQVLATLYVSYREFAIALAVSGGARPGRRTYSPRKILHSQIPGSEQLGQIAHSHQRPPCNDIWDPLVCGFCLGH